MSSYDDDDEDDYDDEGEDEGGEDEDDGDQSPRELTYTDLIQARERRDPRFASLVIRYADQPDPPENAPEDSADAVADGGERAERRPLPPDAWTLARLRNTLAPHGMWGKTADEKRALRREAWNALMAAPHPPPRLRLGGLLIELYEQGDEWSRAALVEIIREARIGWGLWQGIKQLAKRVEDRHDAEMFGILTWRLDAVGQTSTTGEVSSATLGYMRRRAWRYLRQLGQAVPELYPQFAVQVLRHYRRGHSFYDSWVANQIWAHKDLIGARSAWRSGPPQSLDRRAFDDAWKIAPEPLLRLLEDAHSDEVCSFAIRSLKADFPAALRNVDPRWLGRIGKKPLSSVHEFVVEILTGSPELHQSKLAALGLHDMVVGLLRSDSDKASAYAIEYANAHAPDIAIADLIDIAEIGSRKVEEFVRARLAKKKPAELGVLALARMLTVSALAKLAREKLDEGFSPDDLTAALYVAMANGESEQQDFLRSFYRKHKQKVPAAFLRAQVEDSNISYWELRQVMQELGKRKAADIGIDWIKSALLDRRFGDYVAEWLRQGMLKGDELDVEWLKGLVMRPSKRPLALELIGNPKLVASGRVGLSWLLAMARQADEALSALAHRYLLEHFEPADLARELGASDVKAGIDKIWSLLGADQPEPVRRFAATYLRVHHPELSASTDEARQLGIKPKLPREAYKLERVRPLFSDANPDVRRLGRAIGKHELVRWGDQRLVYELAANRFREGRALAAEALLHIGETDADPKLVPPVEWLSAPRVFALAESPIKSTREVALTLIRRHYDRLGGPARLGWLMESPDREVRLFAVRLLWDKHRPIVKPRGERPGDGRFDSAEALREFVRTVLFGLPPGRMERRESTGEALPDRPLPASVAKRRLLEVVRDMAVEELEFARLVIPVLEEFMRSQAKGEWQGCVAALARIRRAHPDLDMALPAAEPLATASPASAGA